MQWASYGRIGIAMFTGALFVRGAVAQCPVPFYLTPAFGSVTKPVACQAADFNLDGRLDLVVQDDFQPGLSVFFGNGNGTFKSPILVQPPFQISGFTTADLNNDGKPDLIAAGGSGLMIFLGNGDGTFQPPLSQPSNAYYVVTVGDVNLDGKPDLITRNGNIDGGYLYLGNGDGTFQAPVNVAIGSYAICVAIGDVNFDHKPDLVVSNLDSVFVLLGNGNGSFSGPTYVNAGAQPMRIALGLLDEDPWPDLAVTHFNNTLSVLLGAGNGNFQAPMNYDVGTMPVGVAIGDLNGDGKNDLVVAVAGSQSVSVLINRGFGAFQPPVNYTIAVPPQQDLPGSVTIGDFNNDGRPDIAVATQLQMFELLSLNLPAIAVAQQPLNQAVGAGQNASFSVTASGVGTYHWRHNGTPLTESTHFVGTASSSLTVVGVTAADRGIFDVQLSAACTGWMLSQPAALNVVPCAGDSNGDGRIDLGDLAALLAVYGDNCP